MNIEDIKYIFKPQLDISKNSNTKLFFMLQDGDTKQMCRHSPHELHELVSMLDNFVYQGTKCSIPRFNK